MMRIALIIAWIAADSAAHLWDFIGPGTGAPEKEPNATRHQSKARAEGDEDLQEKGGPFSRFGWFFSFGQFSEDLPTDGEQSPGDDAGGNGPWLFRLGLKFLFQAAESGFAYCGTLCASLGLAAKWTYWLVTGVVVVFLLQLLVWTYTWVVYPAVVHSRALWRYCRGHYGASWAYN